MTPCVGNLWYMAGWTEEVPEDHFLARTLLDRHWLIFRSSDGHWAMLADRCPHRFAALSRGQRHGDMIQCGYHGLGFDRDGHCVHNPFGGTPPPGARVPTLPIVERYGALWFWPGDPALADPDAIPDFAFTQGPDQVRGSLRMEASYEYITDNFMDLSHAEFIHRESFGVNGALLHHGMQRVRTDDQGAIWNNWDIVDADPPSWAVPLLPQGARVDQWLHMRWHAPASMVLYIGMARTGTGGKDLVMPPMANPHIITPETSRSSHYFYTRGPGEEAVAMVRRVFEEEDEPMIRSVQQGFGDADFWEARPVILPSDAGAIRARRALMQPRRAEQTA